MFCGGHLVSGNNAKWMGEQKTLTAKEGVPVQSCRQI